MKLGVNIDHVATLRQVRRARYPDPVQAAVLAETAGADQITVHLREDRRHIQDRDIRVLKEAIQTRLNLEMALTEPIAALALELKPYRVTFVPERREEITTEGGLNVLRDESKVAEFTGRFRRAGIEVSLFVDPSNRQIEASRRVNADAIELHTGSFANAFDSNLPTWREERQSLKDAAAYARNHKLKVYAGHGLNIYNIEPVVAIREIEELNIGHAIVARSILIGMPAAVREIKQLMYRADVD